MSAPDIDAIEARAKAATQGRWALEREELNAEDFSDEEQNLAFFSQIGPWEIQGHDALYGGGTDEDHDLVEADAAFMETAVIDVLALVSDSRRLREERNILAREIAEASQRLGGYNGEVPLTGPQVLLLLRDMEQEFVNQREQAGTLADLGGRYRAALIEHGSESGARACLAIDADVLPHSTTSSRL